MIKKITTGVVLVTLPIFLLMGYESTDVLTVVATDETYKQAGEWLDFLEEKEIPVNHITPAEYSKGIDLKYVVLMGGLDEPGGVKNIVKKILFEEEFRRVNQKGAFKTITKVVIPKDVPPAEKIRSGSGGLPFMPLQNKQQRKKDNAAPKQKKIRGG